MQKQNCISIGNAGEYFVAGELERHGFTVALPMSNVKDFDILVVNRQNSHSQFCIQVKTTSYSKKEWTLSSKNEKLIGDNVVYVFVTLNKLGTPEYHVVPSKVVAQQISETHRQWLQSPGKKGQKHNDNPVRKFSDADDVWLDRWDVLTGVSNTGNEPFAEYYASQIAEMLGVNAISYSLTKWKGRLCSFCDLFTSKELSFIPAGRLVTKGGLPAVRNYCETLGDEFAVALNEMLVFDAVICNTDRHFGNFGFLVDSHSNRIVAPAPLFDHGNSLFSLAPVDAFENIAAMRKYRRTLLPRVYDDFIGEAKTVITHKQRNALRHLLDFRFKRNPRHNWSAQRLTMVERMVSEQAKELVG